MSSMQEIIELCNTCDIICLQETWLSKQNLDFLASIHTDFHGTGISYFDDGEGMLVGRPFGGTAILWHKKLQATQIQSYNKSIIGLNILTDDVSLCVINVYLPYCCSDNFDSYLQYMTKLQVWAESLDNANLCIVGDFNASSANMFGKLLEDFAAQQDLVISDKACLPSDTFTYLSDAHGTVSWLDHCISSHSLHQSIDNKMCIMNFLLLTIFQW